MIKMGKTDMVEIPKCRNKTATKRIFCSFVAG